MSSEIYTRLPTVPGSLTTITDTVALDSGFLLHNYIVDRLKQLPQNIDAANLRKSKVLLVGLSQILNHYMLICKKLGTNLAAHKVSGTFLFIDALTRLHSSSTSAHPISPQSSASSPSAYYSLPSDCTLKSFYELIVSLIEPDTESNWTVIFDDLTCLLYSGCTGTEIVKFIHQLKVFLDRCNGHLVALCHDDKADPVDLEHQFLLRSMFGLSDYIIQSKALESGASKDITGSLFESYTVKCEFFTDCIRRMFCCTSSLSAENGSDQTLNPFRTVAPFLDGNPIPEKCLIQESTDEFDQLDTNKWSFSHDLSGGNNWELQWYSDDKDTTFVKDGKLHILPRLTADVIGEKNMLGETKTGSYELTIPKEQCTAEDKNSGCSRKAVKGGSIINPVISAKLNSKFTVKPNTRVEVRAKLPKGDWLWPAVWLLPKENKYGPWPASGEIDLIEAKGNMDSIKTVDNLLHFGVDAKTRKSVPKSLTLGSGTFADDFHTFTLDWTENGIKTSVDGNELLNIDFNNVGSIGAPFDQEFYMILNVAVGGNFFNGFKNKPWKEGSETAPREFWEAKDEWFQTWGEHSALVIDYIRSIPLNSDGTPKC
ncbi:concanavalin A-like lectin/glucanase domain-containing protein [Paraphysoderma sedebokerense]|nr:concanavalin A-like lectin/glucanase domain-containing protein [Paraphysoderma sedebokerense]